MTTLPLADINTVLNMAITQERQQSCGNIQSQITYAQGVVNVVRVHNGYTVPQINAVNFQNSGGRRFNGQRKTFYYTFCNGTGHTIERCYKKHCYPPKHKFKGKNGSGLSNVRANGGSTFVGNILGGPSEGEKSSGYAQNPNGSITRVVNPMWNVNSASPAAGPLMHNVGAHQNSNAISNRTIEQFDKLFYLLNDTQLHSSMHAGTVGVAAAFWGIRLWHFSLCPMV